MGDYDIPNELRYTRDDEWVRIDGERATVGITDFAQQELGDIVFVELPEVGSALEAGASFGVVESVKAVSDLFSPLGGTVAEINEALADAPERVNESCYGEGWMIVVEGIDSGAVDALLDAGAYAQSIAERKE